MNDVEIETSNAVDFAATGGSFRRGTPVVARTDSRVAHNSLRLDFAHCSQRQTGRDLPDGKDSEKSLFLYALLPASLPHLLSGLKQGWAFAWRSLMQRNGFRNSGTWAALDDGADLNDINEVVAVMLLIVAIGFLTDAVFFRILERSIQRKWGLAPAS